MRWLATVLLSLAFACASSEEIRVVPEVERAAQDRREGEKVYSTSYAIRLAELVLRGEGADYLGRDVAVSFCDGVYTVTFRKPYGRVTGCDFIVDIDAETSRILKVVTRR